MADFSKNIKTCLKSFLTFPIVRPSLWDPQLASKSAGVLAKVGNIEPRLKSSVHHAEDNAKAQIRWLKGHSE